MSKSVSLLLHFTSCSHFLFCRYKKFCTITHQPGSRRPTKLSNLVLQIVNQQMRLNDETTAVQLHDILTCHGISISLRTVLRSREQLGWTFSGSAYCQLVHDANKAKRLEWAQQHINDDFVNVIWTDEASVQLETHRKRGYRKKGERPKPKPRPKHPVKVHVWAGIRMEGTTKILIFSGIMKAEFYVQILERYLVPFLAMTFADKEHRFMQDNDPKHVSLRAREFFENNGINWWRTPPESPQLKMSGMNLRSIFDPESNQKISLSLFQESNRFVALWINPNAKNI